MSKDAILEEQVLNYLQTTGKYGFKQAFKIGVSPSFVAGVIVANIDEIISEWLDFTQGIGELCCPNCDEFFNRSEAVINEDGNSHCSKCGKLLKSAYCALCYRDLELSNGTNVGQQVFGFCFCVDCVPRAKAELRPYVDVNQKKE